MKILIADSGATKTDWLYFDGQEFVQVQTQGLHPANIQNHQDEMDIRSQVGELKPEKVLFYGTGCGNPVSDEIIKRFLSPVFPQSIIEVRSDLEGSGRAFFGEGDGVVAVLGTGAVCARIEAGKVAKKSAALGYAIGDEGSAADLGRRILRFYYRKSGSPDVVDFIAEKLETPDYGDMMNRIYSSPKPNRELASIAGKVFIYPYPGKLNELLREAFSDFIEKQLSTLELSENESIIFTGKVADVHQKLLIEMMNDTGYKNVKVLYPVIASWRKRLMEGQKF